MSEPLKFAESVPLSRQAGCAIQSNEERFSAQQKRDRKMLDMKIPSGINGVLFYKFAVTLKFWFNTKILKMFHTVEMSPPQD